MEKFSTDKPVTIGAMTIIVTLFSMVIGWLFYANTALSSRIDGMTNEYLSIQTQLSQIQTDIAWIKINLDK